MRDQQAVRFGEEHVELKFALEEKQQARKGADREDQVGRISLPARQEAGTAESGLAHDAESMSACAW